MAICVFPGHGYVLLDQKPSGCRLEIVIHDWPGKDGSVGFHAHEFGDIRSCDHTGAHYNPDGKKHGGLSGERHLGDFGNINIRNGRVNQIIYAGVSVKELIGRSLIIHDQEDDLGLGDHSTSSETGNSGKRVLCGVIGIRSLTK